MSTKVPRFTAYKDVECAICAQPAHGQHFGIVTCRPCAAFFKRCVIEKSSYRCVQGNNQCNIKFDSTDKKCKACRLRQCNLVGMEYRSRKNSAESSEEEEEESSGEMADERVPSPIGPCPSDVLKKLTAGYDLFLVRQKVHFQRTYRSNGGAEKMKMFVPENLDYIRHFEQSIRPMFFDLFVECLEPFAAMEMMDSKFALFDECFAHLNLLNACFLSLRHFPGKNDQKFLIDFGHLMDMERKEEILQKWTKSINQPEIISQQRELIEKKFVFIQRLKKLGHKIGKEEICALMAIIICIKAPSTFEWKKMKALILMELLHFIFKTMNSMRKASKQFANLLALLGQMDMFLIKHKKAEIAPLQRPCIIEGEMPMPMEIDQQNKEPNELEYFVDITNAYRRIWLNIFHDSGEIVVQRAEQFDTFEEFLGSGENILNFQHLFPTFYHEEGQLSKAEIIHEISQMQKITYHPRIRRKNIISRLLNVGLFKAMMHHRLHLVPIQDQVILNAQIGPAINALICTHFATQMGASTWSDADGLSGMAKLSANKMLREDCRFMMLAERAWIRPVKHFSSIKLLSQEEFSILLAILCTHTAIPDISDSTKELLYADQSRYSAMLLQYLQKQFGLESGAKRYAECMQLLNVVFYSAHNFDLLRTYLEAFHSPRGFTSEIVPKCLIPLM